MRGLTKAQRMAELIERLEKATGADRELDEAIWCATEPAIVPLIPHWTKSQREDLAPRYTASLDAAVALVERMGFHWLRKSPISMTVYRPLTPEQDARKEWAVHHSSAGATPVLALLLALLRALSKEEQP